MRQPKIISLGEVLWDIFPEGRRFGGAPANLACHASLLGGEVTIGSAVGDDAHGREAITHLENFGVKTHHVQFVADAPTGAVSIELDDQGKPTFSIEENSAWDFLMWSEELEACVRSADAVYFGTLGQRSPTSRATIQRALTCAAAVKIPRLLDVNLRAPFYDANLIRESVENASILKLSDDEFPCICSACGISLTENPIQALQDLHHAFPLDLVVMTRGAEGALLVSQHETIDQPGIPTIVKDTVGAGDAFTAAFLTGVLNGEPEASNLENACKIAAEVCTHRGALPPSKQSGSGHSLIPRPRSSPS